MPVVSLESQKFLKENSVNIFQSTHRPNAELFYSRNDPLDKKMGEFVQHDPGDYKNANIVVVGCPQDEGVRRNKGRIGAAKAPDEIRKALYRMSVPEKVLSQSIFDVGNVHILKTLEQTHDLLTFVIYQILADGKRIIILGGGNDISYPDCVALSKTKENILAFNIDSHFDVRADAPRNSGTPYRQLLEGGYLRPENFYQIAFKPIANSPAYRRYLKDKGVNMISLNALRERGVTETLRLILDENTAEAIFWGFDIDAVRASDAPGVSASYPTGLTANEIYQIAEIAGSDERSQILEITEVNPDFDIDNRTSKLAAMVILHFLNA